MQFSVTSLLVLFLQAPGSLALQELPAALLSRVAWSFKCAREGRRPLVLGRDVELRETRGKGTGVYALRDLKEGEVRREWLEPRISPLLRAHILTSALTLPSPPLAPSWWDGTRVS